LMDIANDRQRPGSSRQIQLVILCDNVGVCQENEENEEDEVKINK
jgi:hypothetical protein